MSKEDKNMLGIIAKLAISASLKHSLSLIGCAAAGSFAGNIAGHGLRSAYYKHQAKKQMKKDQKELEG